MLIRNYLPRLPLTQLLRSSTFVTTSDSTSSTSSQRLIFRGEFTIVDDLLDQLSASSALARLVAEASDHHGIIGVDTETCCSRQWKGELPHKTSLLQLSSRSSCVIYRLNKLQGKLPAELVNFLENPGLLKTGVQLKQDMATLMYEQEQINTINGCVELSTLAKAQAKHIPQLARKDDEGKSIGHGLKSLSDVLLTGGTFHKNKRIARSNWSKTLSTKMLSYAATDAWIGCELGVAMNNTITETGSSTDISKFSISLKAVPNKTASVIWPSRSIKVTSHNGEQTHRTPRPPSSLSQPVNSDMAAIVEKFIQSDASYLQMPQGLTPKTRFFLHRAVEAHPNIISVSTGYRSRKMQSQRTMHLFKVEEKDRLAFQQARKDMRAFTRGWSQSPDLKNGCWEETLHLQLPITIGNVDPKFDLAMMTGQNMMKKYETDATFLNCSRQGNFIILLKRARMEPEAVFREYRSKVELQEDGKLLPIKL